MLLIYDKIPESRVDKAMLAEFTAKGVAVIGLTPGSVNPTKASFPIVRNTVKFFWVKPWQAALSYTLLLRRDRYVAAVARNHEIGALTVMIDRIRVPHTS